MKIIGKLIVVSILLLSSVQQLKSQALLYDFIADDSIGTCQAVIYDAGGQMGSGGYLPLQNDTLIICPDQPNQKIELDFASFDLAVGDTMCVYDGANMSAPLLGCYTSTALDNTFIAAFTGCITLHFKSDTTIENQGWAILANCNNCQQIIPGCITVPDFDPNTTYIDVCQGDSVHFQASSQFPENNISYAQSDATSTFIWYVNNSTYTTPSFFHRFNFPGYYPVFLEVTDVNTCKRRRQIVAVRVSGKPNYVGSMPNPSNICQNDTVELYGAFQTQYYSYNFSSGGSPLALPDNIGTPFQSTTAINIFAPGQMMTSASDLQSICVNMEHSFIGDLQIELICPSGQSIVLSHQVQNGAGNYLGGANDGDGVNPVPGIGWDYCWAMGAPNGTWDNYLLSSSIFSDTLPAGTYAPDDAFAGLIGCPLNGDWTFQVTDLWSADNGFIFSWDLNFDPTLFPSAPGFQNTIQSTYWTYGSNTISTQDTTKFYITSSLDTDTFKFHTIDDFGCEYDTNIVVGIDPASMAEFSVVEKCLNAQPLNFLDVSVTPAGAGAISTWNWTFGDGSTGNVQNPTHTFAVDGDYQVNLKVTNTNGCSDDTTMIVQVFPEPVADFINDPECINGGAVRFKDKSTVNSGNVVKWIWNFGDGTPQDSSSGAPSHDYNIDNVFQVTLQVVTDKGCKDAITKPAQVFEKPTAGFLVDIDSACTPLCLQTINISYSLTSNITQSIWSLGNGATSFDPNPAVCFDKTGTYTIELVAKNSFGCYDTVKRKVYSEPIPVADFDYQPYETNLLNPEIKFLDQTEGGGGNWEWYIDYLLFDTVQHPFFTFTDTAKHRITLITQNKYGCVDSTFRYVKVDPFFNVYVPNAFSPNSDGKNDFFQVIGNGVKSDGYELSIFNRWGINVHTMSNISDKWDGKISGDAAEIGVYQYVFTFRDIFNKKHKKVGEVLLLR